MPTHWWGRILHAMWKITEIVVSIGVFGVFIIMLIVILMVVVAVGFTMVAGQ